MHHHEVLIHIVVPGSAHDPRQLEPVPGIVMHRTPPLHPDDLDVVDGIPVTSVQRTLIDCAEVMSRDEVRELFAAARRIGRLDPKALRASRARCGGPDARRPARQSPERGPRLSERSRLARRGASA
jgi:hypothetical protein